MNAGDPPADELTPAERRLTQHLELLRASPPTGAPQLVATVIRSVRWQRAVREPLGLMGAVAVAVFDGLALLFGPTSSSSSSPSPSSSSSSSEEES
jgi:hypothetical protein